MRTVPELINMLESYKPDVGSTKHLAMRFTIRGIRNDGGKKWTTHELVSVHNYLVGKLLEEGIIVERERDLLNVLDAERRNSYKRIFERGQIKTVPHAEGISQHKPSFGRTEYIYGQTRLQLWGVMNKKAGKRIKT